jgi:hypothetical protein
MPDRIEKPPWPGVTAFGDALRTAFRVPDAPVLLARDLTYGPLSVTELRCDADGYGTSGPLPEHDALMVSLQLRSSVDHEIWADGRRLPKTLVETGSTSFFDLRRGVIASSMRPFHSLNFVFPLRALDEATDEVLYRFELGRVTQQGVEDPVIRALGTSLLPALEHPPTASRLFVDHVLFALRAHVAARFGTPADRFTESGGLAVWQERRAREFIEARLAGNVALADVARECGLSVAQFARAFKRSHRTGAAALDALRPSARRRGGPLRVRRSESLHETLPARDGRRPRKLPPRVARETHLKLPPHGRDECAGMNNP